MVVEVEELARSVPLSWWDYIPAGLKIKEYCDLTTLHGFRYFSEKGRSLSERYVVTIEPKPSAEGHL